MASTIQQQLTRLDAFANVLTGAGGSGDKGSSWTPVQDVPLNQDQLKTIWKTSYYGRRIIDLPTSDALVNGWSVVDPDDNFIPEDFRWQQLAETFNLKDVLHRADTTASALGTGYIIPITYDGDNSAASLSRPLDMNRLHTVTQFLVLEPQECTPEKFWGGAAVQSAMTDLLRPSKYRLNATHGLSVSGRWSGVLSGTQLLHSSRVIKIVGLPIAVKDLLVRPYGEGDSILQAIWLAIARAEGVDAAAAVLSQEMKQDVIRIPDLKAIGTGDEGAVFKLRMKLVKAGLSMFNMVVLGQGEEFESRSSTVAGFSDLSDATRNALVAASGISEPILFGKATSGLATAPGAEQEAYNRLVNDRRARRIQPALRQILTLLAASRSGPFQADARFRRFKITFPPLLVESLKELESRRVMQGQRDATYAGMLSNAGLTDVAAAFAKHVITNRYGPDGWQDDIPPFSLPTEASEAPKPPKNGPGAPEGGPLHEKDSAEGQKPSLKKGAPKSPGAPGVDIQANNTGKGPLDS